MTSSQIREPDVQYRTRRLILVGVLGLLASGLVGLRPSNAGAARLPHRHDRRAARHRRARQARTPDARPAAGRDHRARGRRAARGEVVPARRRRTRRRRPVHARLGRRPAGSAAPGHARLAGLRPPGPERPQAGAEGGAGLPEEAAPDRAVGGGVLARQPAAHAAGLLAQRRRAVRGRRSRDDVRREGGRRAAAGGEPGAGRARPVRAAGRWCRGQSGDRGRRRGGAADARDDRAHADAGHQHRDLAARPRDVLSADGAGQGAGRPRRPEGDPALLGGHAGAQRGRGDLPGDDQRSQPRQRERLCDRRARARYEPRPGRRRRGARQGRPRQPAGDGQARRRRHVDGRSAERRPRALELQVQHAVGAARAGRGHRRRADRQHQRPRQGPRPRHRGSGELLRDRLRAEERRGRRQLPQDRGQGGAQGRRRDLAQRLLRAAGQRRGAAAAVRAAAARRRRGHAAAARLRLQGRRVPLPRDDARPPVHAGDRGAGRLARGRGRQEGEAVPHPVHRDGAGQGRERARWSSA